MPKFNCPCCNQKEIKKSFTSWEGIPYSICKNCKTSYQDPPLTIDYKEDSWGQKVDPDNKLRDLTKEKEFKIKNWYGDTIKYVNSKNPGKILDVGCGLGFFLFSINEAWERHALEVSEEAINFIKENDKKIIINKGTIEINTLEENLFDVIFFYHVFEHLENPIESLDKISKLLKPNGTLILGTPNNSSLCAKIFGGNYRLLCKAHKFLVTSSYMKKILIQKNFSIKKVEYPYFKTDYFNLKNILKLFFIWKVSPPFFGNIMTFYMVKK